jgi:adenylate kinase
MAERIEIDYFHGLPGAGKDTQASLIQSVEPHAVVISTGELFRRAVKSRSERVRSELVEPAKTGLVPDDVIFGLVEDEMAQYGEENINTILFTGFPRNLSQLDAVDTWMEHSFRQEGIDVVEFHLLLDVRESTAAEHLIHRQEREEDTDPEKIAERFRVHRELTMPMLDRLADESRLHRLDGEKGTPDVVFQDIQRARGRLKNTIPSQLHPFNQG